MQKEPPKNLGKTQNKNLIQLVSCPKFTVWKKDIKTEDSIIQDQPFMLVSVLEGEGSIDDTHIQKGNHFILPSQYGQAHFSGNMEIIISSI